MTPKRPIPPRTVPTKEELGKVGLDFIVRHMTDSQTSHEASWIYLRYNQMKHMGIDATVIHDNIAPKDQYDVWAKFDTIFIYHGMAAFPERGGAFGSCSAKCFDGPTDKGTAPPPVNVYDIGVTKSAWYFARLGWPQHEKLRYISMDFPMIPYGDRCLYKAPRAGTSQEWKNVDWPAVQRRLDRDPGLWCIDPVYDYSEGPVHFTVGDSHIHSVYKPTSVVLRRDARTLHAINRKGIMQEIVDSGFDHKRVKSLTTHFGSIDIRHHLCRQPDPKASMAELLKGYEKNLQSTGVHCEIAMPLPIEDESRKIPSSAWYKGTPFFGTRVQRMELLKQFMDGVREMAHRNGWAVFEWPAKWYEMDGVDFMENFMEKPRSIHLAWRNYRWDLKNDKPNDLENLSWEKAKPAKAQPVEAGNSLEDFFS